MEKLKEPPLVPIKRGYRTPKTNSSTGDRAQEHKDEISSCPKEGSLLQPTTTQPLTFKALKTTGITNLGRLSLPPLFF